jgi:hypothetical protein
MREIEAVIEQIQSVLAWEHDPEQDYMETLVADYTRHVSAANERLRQCESLLSQGLRTEAIQQCETQPNLLDLTAILDFPEVEFWSDYVSQYELPPLPNLMLEVAADLNDAYAAAQPVEGLLKLHRLHALALSPLSVRIQILRELAKKDSSNPLWLEDLAQYEDARYAQIETELEKIVASKNTRQAAAIEAELSTRKWTTAPPQDLLRKAQVVRTRLQTYDARKELRSLSDRLNEAHAASDLEQARSLTARWNMLVPIANLPQDEPVLQTVIPALQWIAKEDQQTAEDNAYQTSIAAMSRALDRDVSADELERCAGSVAQFEDGIPDELNERLQDRLAAIDQKAKRKTMILFGLIAAGVLVVLAIAFTLIQSSRHGQNVVDSQARLQQLIDQGEMSQAANYYKNLSSAVAQSPELLTLNEQLLNAQQKETTRRDTFVGHVQAAESGIFGNPDTAAIEEALSQLTQAEAAAQGEAEQTQVHEAGDAVAAAQKVVQIAVDTLFQKDLAAATKQFHRGPDGDMEVNQTLMKLFVELKQRSHVTETLKQRISEIIRTLDTARADFQRLRKVRTDMKKVTGAIGNIDRFGERLREYIRNHPGDDRSPAIQRLLTREADLWAGPDLWKQARTDWETVPFRAINSESADLLLGKYATFMSESHQFPAGHKLAKQVAALQAIAARKGDRNSSLLERLREPLEFYLKLPLMIAHGDKHYYTDEEERPRAFGDEIKVVPFRNEQFARDTEKRIPITEITNRYDGDDIVWDAPHAVFAKEALEELAKAPAHWEESFGKLVTGLSTDDGIDPIVKMKLLYSLLETGSKGSTFFAQAFSDSFAAVDMFTGNGANWIITSGTGAPSGRISANAILKNLSSLEDASRQAVKMRDALSKQKPDPEYRWIGWLHRQPDRVWNCATGEQLKSGDSGALVVIIPQDDVERPSRFTTVGSVASGKVSLDNTGTTAGFAEGRPVYLVDGQPQ